MTTISITRAQCQCVQWQSVSGASACRRMASRRRQPVSRGCALQGLIPARQLLCISILLFNVNNRVQNGVVVTRIITIPHINIMGFMLHHGT